MNKYFKKLLLPCCAAAFSLCLMANSSALHLHATLFPTHGTDSGINPQSDNIGWRFKTENGKTYKRLYNYTTKKWIGNWILVP